MYQSTPGIMLIQNVYAVDRKHRYTR